MSAAIRLVARSEADTDKAVIDQWTPVVFGAGVASGVLDLSTETVVIGAFAFEVVQAWPPSAAWMQGSGESLANKTGDLAVFILGYWLGKKLKTGA